MASHKGPPEKRLYRVQQLTGHGGNARGVHHQDPDDPTMLRFVSSTGTTSTIIRQPSPYHSVLQGSRRRMSSTLKFSSFDVTNQAFYRTEHCFAIVNLKPIAPGHVLVIPRRTEAKRLADLSRDEVADLFGSVQKIGSVMEVVHKASSLTVAIQDGPFAGQSVPHLHVHVIPRRPNDFVPNDKIYDHLNRFDASIEKPSDKEEQVTQLKIDNEERVARTPEDMQAEATSLRQHFQD